MTRPRLRRADLASVIVLAAAAAALPGPGPAAVGATGPATTALPTIAGVLQQGRKLTAAPGDWLGAGTITYAYQWYRCDARGAHCSSIHGATDSTYTEVAQDVGHSVAVTVRASDGTGTTPAYAPLAGLVASATSTLTVAKQPTLTGDAIVGRLLTVTGGSWLGHATTTTYTWLRCNANGRACSTIAGATAATYAPAAGDTGHRLVAAVTGSAQGMRRTALSLASAQVRPKAGPLNAQPPLVAGMLEAGRRLAATPGTWLGTAPIAYAYQWYRCDDRASHCSAIHGATRRTYVQVARDVDATLALTVRATDADGTSAAYSSAAGVVAAAGAALVVTAQATLVGSAAVGGTLAAAAPTWSAPVSSAATAWLRCNANGRSCSPIAGAVGGTYSPVAADVGHRLVAEVRARSGPARDVALSVASAVVER